GSSEDRVNQRTGEAITLNNLGEIYRWQGNYREALNYFDRALTIARDIGNSIEEAIALGNLGTIDRLQGNYTQALSYYEQSLAIAKEIGDPAEHELRLRMGEATTLNNIGEIYRLQENYDQALNYYDRSLAIAREITDRTREAIVLNNLGEIYQLQGSYSQALDYYQQSLAIDFTPKTEVEIKNADSIAKTFSNLGWLHNTLEQYKQATEALYQSIIFFEYLRYEDIPDEARINVFEIQNRPYRHLQISLVAQGEIERALEISERGRARAFASLLAEKQRILLLGTPPIAQIKQIARQENATLVQYSVVSDDRLFIWVIQPTGTVDFREIDLSSLNGSLEDHITTIRENIGIRSRDPDGTIVAQLTQEEQQRRNSLQRQSLQKLYQLLIEPIAELLPTDPEAPIVFIPQDSLFLVPFPALVNAEGEYLIQNHTVLTAPAIQVFDLTRENRRTQNRTLNPENFLPENFLIVGNPTMPSVWNPNTDKAERLSSLPGAEDEAVAIAELFDTQPLLWDDATETAVTQRMKTAQIIHLATHGLLDYGRETGERDFPGAIALAAGNGEDGLLTTAELLDMELLADLVVLSACDTGRGKLSSDGVIGLSRALIGAGVPNVMVSLWSVPDTPTSDLMVEFYRQWQTTGNKAQSLRQAMLTTMEKHPEPVNWAAFTLIGEAHTGSTSDESSAETRNTETTSEGGVDYTQLERYLAAGEWEEANRETAKLMFELDERDGISQARYNHLVAEELSNFPCADLNKIDRLWTTYSDRHFGFSIQADIRRSYRSGSGNMFTRMGWRRSIRYEDVTFDLTAPKGHLPLWRNARLDGVIGCEPRAEARNICLVLDYQALFDRVITCQNLTEEATPEVKFDYSPLQQSLEAGDWKQADWETAKLMVEVVNRDNNIWHIWLSPERRGALSTQDLLDFPCEELEQIDRLWVTNSNGRFGFSIQSEIYHDLGGTEEFGNGLMRDFLTRVGWSNSYRNLNYEDVTFDITSPEGYFPLWNNTGTDNGIVGVTCGLNPFSANKCLHIDAGALLTRVKACGL
ncbi:MAG: CHAT domain-containing protein, partial [Geitlerinemataceae cyanobacterium]